MPSLAFRFLFSIIPCVLAVQLHPVVRSVSSNVSCTSGYQWMDNAQNDSPCLTAAYVEAACSGGTYVQPPLKVGYNYALPNSSTATPCYCSWSSYNLMMACTLCQGSQFSNSLWQWPQWANGCTTNPSWAEVYFPSGYVLAGGASIPYWATLNPANWTYETFDIEEANATYRQNPSDIYPGSTPSATSGTSSSTSSSTSTDVGTIVGVVVGTAAALALLAVGAYLLYRRHVFKKGAHAAAANRQRTDRNNGAATSMTHSRLPSDTSYYPLSPSQQYGVYSPQPQTVYPGSFSPPPPTVTSVYTSRSNQPSGAMPLV